MIEEYKQNIDKYQTKYNVTHKQFLWVTYLRLVVFLTTIIGMYYFWDNNEVKWSFLLVGLVIFTFLIRKSSALSYHRRYLKKMLEFNQHEILANKGIYNQYPDGNRFINPEHDYSYDIDLFGEGSFFQYINRCQTSGGEDQLSNGLIAPDFDIINDRQVAIDELSNHLDWNQDYLVTASLIDDENREESVKGWLNQYKKVLPSFMKYIIYGFPIITLLTLGLIAFDFIPFNIIYINFLSGVAITAGFLKKINSIHNESSKITNLLSQYARLLKLIEQKEFDAPLLKHLKLNIQEDDVLASAILQKLYKIFNSLDQRSNMLLGIILNGLFLTDLNAIMRLDRWMEKYKTLSLEWFDAVYAFDELCSSGIYMFNHKDFVFATTSTSHHTQIDVEGLGHPLINKTKRINNDYQLKKHNFTIITGANMAGKSTFLRALGINIILANNGMPVCADKMDYSPINLISSMRTTDSLNKEESYFFSELKRLKYIVDKCKEQNYFIILDEILKGTNSKDKAEGSQKFLEKMRTSGSSGVIATHDLSLCRLSDMYEEFDNKYFDAEIVNDELFFDYTLKKGMCQNMNASFLLKKMDII